MADFLKGNYKLSKKPGAQAPKPAKKAGNKLTQEFEQAALSKLGGSLCFVMKKNTFMWSGDSATHTHEATGQDAH
jgi:hypothetical protein